MGKPLLQPNLISITFVIALLLIGVSAAAMLLLELTKTGKLAFILIMVSAFFTAVALFIELLKRRKEETRLKG